MTIIRKVWHRELQKEFPIKKGWLPALICILIALFFLWRAVGEFPGEYLRELYEEGLMVAQEGAAAVNGCYCLEVKELDGAKKELFEKSPVPAFSVTKGVSTIRPFSHPLY